MSPPHPTHSFRNGATRTPRAQPTDFFHRRAPTTATHSSIASSSNRSDHITVPVQSRSRSRHRTAVTNCPFTEATRLSSCTLRHFDYDPEMGAAPLDCWYSGDTTRTPELNNRAHYSVLTAVMHTCLASLTDRGAYMCIAKTLQSSSVATPTLVAASHGRTSPTRSRIALHITPHHSRRSFHRSHHGLVV